MTGPGPAGLAIDPAGADERPVFENLLQLYIHDFSEQWAGTDRGELQDDGRFAPYEPLDLYWREPARVPLLIRHGGRLAGFALLNDHSVIERPAERVMAEFFIVRKHRRDGLGTAAARAIFARYPGRWEVAVARANRAALAFWRSAIGGAPLVGPVEEMDIASEAWTGPLFRFETGGAAAN